MTKILKSSRHSKLTGDFGEALVLYMLSRHGFECAKIDHTGIDLIARHPRRKLLMGISVKSRTRISGQEDSPIRVDGGNLVKCQNACKAFGLEPYYALIIDRGDRISAYIVEEAILQKYAPKRASRCIWHLSSKACKQYAADPSVMTFEMPLSIGRWWDDEKTNG